jgi:hypothetical protein
MWPIALLAVLACCGCAPREQPSTIAAIEIPVQTYRDRADLVAALNGFSAAERLHVDAATEHELENVRDKLPVDAHATLRMGVWRGQDDKDLEMSVTDMGHQGRAWISIIRYGDLDLPPDARERLFGVLRNRWPQARMLPVLPTGGLPLARDLIATADGYKISASAAGRYKISATSPLLVAEPTP